MEIRKKALGKGLSALIPDSYAKMIQEKQAVEGKKSESAFQEINISEIKPNKDQPRRHFTEEGIQELSQSIKEQGILQPVIVKKAVAEVVTWL